MKISVAMTTYNGASYLRQQLDSIFSQTRLPDELIICDDQSADETPQILQDYAKRAPFPTTIIANGERLGSAKNFEKTIALCAGDIIALSDQDDVWKPEKLARVEQAFDAYPNTGLIFTNGDLIDDQSAVLTGDLWSSFKFNARRRQMLRGPSRYDLLLERPFITGATLVFRSTFRSLVLPIPGNLRTFVHDRWIATLIASIGKIEFIDEKLIQYRLHRGQQLGIGKVPKFIIYAIPYRFSSDRVALAAIRERLSQQDFRRPHPEFMRALDTRERHVSARADLPRNPLRRLAPIAKEYRSGRYHHYSRGILSALKDVAVGTR